MNIKFKVKNLIVFAAFLTSMTQASVSDMKQNGSARGYNLIEDQYVPTLNDPAFGSNELGSYTA